MFFLIAFGATFACIMAILQGRRSARPSKPVVVQFVSLRAVDPCRKDATVGLRDPARPL